MDLEELQELIKTKEGHKLEFKEKPSKNLANEMVAFANADGGRILIGVSDTGEIKGLEKINKKDSQVYDFAYNCEPPVTIKTETVGKVLVVEVKEGNEIHKAPNGFYLRQGPNSQKLSRQEIINLMHERGEIVFDEIICKEFNYPEDFDEDAFNKFLEKADITDNLDIEKFLKNLGVAKEEKLRFTNAGVLMFAKNPKQFFIQAEIICGVYESENRADLRDRKVIEKPIILSIPEAEQFTLNNTEKKIVIEELTRKRVPEIPKEVLREAIVNAVMHTDYHGAAESIQIDIFPEKIEIRNPGGLIEGMRKEDLGEKSRRRNPNIANILDKTGYAERMGTGVNRMKKAMKESNLPEPKFDTNSHFQVTLQRERRIGPIELSEAGINDRQKKALRVTYKEGRITNSRYREITDASRATAKKDLKDMVSKDLLEMKGEKKGAYYIPKEGV